MRVASRRSAERSQRTAVERSRATLTRRAWDRCPAHRRLPLAASVRTSRHARRASQVEPLAGRRHRRREGHPHPAGRASSCSSPGFECFVDLGPRPEGRAHVALRGGRQRGDRRGRARRGGVPRRDAREHIAELVRDRQGAAPRRGHDRGALPRAQAGAGLRHPDPGDLHAATGRRWRPSAARAGSSASPAPGHDRLPVRPGARRRPRARAPAERRLRRRARSSGSSRPSRSPPTTSAASGRCTSAAPRTATRRSTRATLLAIVEQSMSSEIYELMKRSDEAAVVEKAHRRPRFVEDCVREMIRGVVEAFPELDDDALRLRPPGEPRDDPPAQRRRRALRHARRAARASSTGEPSTCRRARQRLSRPRDGWQLTRPAPRGVSASSRARCAGRVAQSAPRCAPCAPCAGRRSSRAREHRDGDGHVDRAATHSGRRGRRSRRGSWRSASTVLTLPNMLAAITTPACVAPIRSTVTANSRAMITIATHAASRCSETSATSAAIDQQLVGERVHQLAEGRDRVARACEVAVDEVGQRGEREDDRGEHVAAVGVAEQRDDQHRHEQDPQHGAGQFGPLA